MLLGGLLLVEVALFVELAAALDALEISTQALDMDGMSHVDAGSEFRRVYVMHVEPGQVSRSGE